MTEKKTIVHRSVRYDRTTIDDARGRLEKAAADWWEAEAEEKHYKDNFPAILLLPLELAKKRHVAIPYNWPITQEQATAMATLFQWMFTPLGQAAMHEVYKRAGWTLSLKAIEKDKSAPVQTPAT
jgi:hypothetical protein